MKYESSDKTSSFGIKPHIKKGYYPGKLLKIELFADRDGNARVGNYGQQLIFEFAVYKGDSETDAPIEPIRYCTDEKMKTHADVVISKFAYHLYKKFDKNKKWIEGEYQTAITPKSAITRLLKALGWEFSAEGVDPDELIGKWVELNIDDYTHGEGDEETVTSTIKDINSYKGPKVGNVTDVKATESPKKVEKQLKHEDVKEDNNEKIKTLEDKIEKMSEMYKDGFVTKEGLDQALEQLQSQIKELRK